MQTVKLYDNTEEFLYEIPVPERTESYTPISHRNVIDKIREEADKNNIVISRYNYSVGRNGRVLVGNFNFNAGDPEFEMRMMFKNSYDKSVSFGLGAGISVVICTNGLIAGENILKRKHTGDADNNVEIYIEEVMKSLHEYFERIRRDAMLFKVIEFTEKAAAEFAGRLFMQDVINSMQLNIVKKQLYENDKFNICTSEDFTAWDFYNSINEALKKSHPTTYIKDHVNLHQFMLDNFIS